MAGLLQTYVDIVDPRKYKETIARESKKENWNGVYLNFAITLLLVLISSFSIVFLSGLTNEPGTPFLLSPIGIVISAVAFQAILFFLGPWMLNFIAKLLGGNGSYGRMIWPLSLVSVVMFVISIPLRVISSGGVVIDILLAIAAFALLIYEVLLKYTILCSVHNSLPRNRSIAAIIIDYAINGVFALIYAFALIYLNF